MRKIIYIVTQSEFGGAQKNVLDLAIAFKNRYDVLVAAGPDGGGKLFKRLADNKINWRQLKWLRRSAANPFIDFMGLVEILSLLIKERPNLLHLHSSKAGFLGSLAGRLTGVKIVYTVHGAVFEASFSRLAKKFFFYLEKFSVYFKDKIICVSVNDKKLWLNYRAAPAEKLFVVHNGLDLNRTDFLSKSEAREYLAGQSANLFEALQGTDSNLKIVGT
ncbi:glycosyltransferase, partial [Patescibacteria group bacterium]|nr:glycosyltransferase [Patescibacteria group bacterium]